MTRYPSHRWAWMKISIDKMLGSMRSRRDWMLCWWELVRDSRTKGASISVTLSTDTSSKFHKSTLREKRSLRNMSLPHREKTIKDFTHLRSKSW